MTTREDGGWAYPARPAERFSDGSTIAAENNGMTLRDYFAAKAMQALFAGAEIVTIECAVPMAYRVADAMLAERNK